MKLLAPFCVFFLSACASTAVRDMDPRSTSASLDRLAAESTSIDPAPAQQYAVPAPVQAPSSAPSWITGQTVMQGFFGVTFYDEVKREGGNTPDVEGNSSGLDQMPLLGGGGQWKLGGESLDYGLEALFSMEGRGNAAAFAVGGGGATIAVDVDMFVLDIYGGPFISKFLGDK